MHKKQHTPPPLILNAGYFIDMHYDGYDGMVNSAKNWRQYCTYRLLPDALKGHHQVLQLHTMQIGYVERPGGFMYDTSSPKDCLSFAVIENCADKACFDTMKLQTDDIVFFDDSRSLNFITNDAIKLCVVNLQKDDMGTLFPIVSKALYKTIEDTDGVMSKTLRDIWDQCTDRSPLTKNKNVLKDAEEQISDLLKKLLTQQTPIFRKLTKGEKKALEIRDQVYEHMDAKIDIDHLVKQHQISHKTLQNSFKSLFGFTPGHFLLQLKLNLVYNELLKSDPKQTTVSQTAQKWGFMHMGHFSGYYSKLFGELPSHTLQTEYLENMPIIEKGCVSRQEEMV